MAQDLATEASLFAQLQEARSIAAQNAAQQQAYAAQSLTLDFSRDTNIRSAAEAINELKRVKQSTISEAQVELNQKASTLANNEGITAGASKGRSMMTYALQGAQAIGTIQQKSESIMTKVSLQAEADNNALANQKLQALNTLKSNLISAPVAALKIQLAGQQGYEVGMKEQEAMNNRYLAQLNYQDQLQATLDAQTSAVTLEQQNQIALPTRKVMT
ncbi:MAG: hypothetical protein JHC33_09600 [Ignisphaera sp.]|nr:hypothetical protein [Ignisphaera sp.]